MQNKVLQILAGVLLAVLVIFVLAKTRNTVAERDYIGKAVRDRDTITLTGEGKVTATPDLARVELGVLTEGATPAAVQSENSKKMNAIISAMKDLKIAEKDLQTSQYNLSPKIQWDNGKQTVIGYQVSQVLTVKIRDFDRIGDVLQKSTELGANEQSGVEFTIDDPASLKDQARLKAIENARKKAQALSDALGLHVVKVVTFTESGAESPIYPMMAAPRAMENLAIKAPAPQVEPGSLDVNMSVSVTFEVR